MAQCSEIGPMLGAFEDQALEPHEYQEVAFHLARCESCTAELADYAALGRELRTLFPAPPLDGFKLAVMRRVDSLPVPFTVRLSRALRGFGEQISTGVGLATAVALAAIITAVLATPYAQIAVRRADNSREIAQVEHAVEQAPVAQASIADVKTARADLSGADDDSQAVISRLESEIPSVAVWSEPRTDTTVIWLPDQQQ